MINEDIDNKEKRCKANYLGYPVKEYVKIAKLPDDKRLKPQEFQCTEYKSSFNYKRDDLDASTYVIEQALWHLLSEDLQNPKERFKSINYQREQAKGNPIREYMIDLASNIYQGASDESVTNALKLATMQQDLWNNPEDTMATLKTTRFNRTTIDTIQHFIYSLGPISKIFAKSTDNFTKFIPTDDYDPARYLTNDSLCITINSSEEPFDEKVILKLLIYYVMGLHSRNKDDFKKLEYLSVYDFNTDKMYQILIDNIDPRIIDTVTNQVIGYDDQDVYINDEQYRINTCIKGRASMVHQPTNGFIKLADFKQMPLNSDSYNFKSETLGPNIFDIVVNCLAKIELRKLEPEYSITDFVVYALSNATLIDQTDDINNLIAHIHPGLDDNSVANVIRLIKYINYTDRYIKFVNGTDEIELAMQHQLEQILANEIPDSTIANVKTMVKRVLRLFDTYKPFVASDIDLYNNSARIIHHGKCEYLSKDTIWSITKGYTKSSQKLTLELLIEYLVGMHIKKEQFKSIKYLGIYNYRTDTVYRLEISKIDPDIIDEVNTSIIGYDK